MLSDQVLPYNWFLMLKYPALRTVLGVQYQTGLIKAVGTLAISCGQRERPVLRRIEAHAHPVVRHYLLYGTGRRAQDFVKAISSDRCSRNLQNR